MNEAALRNAGLQLLLQVGLFAWVDYQPTRSSRRGSYRTATGVADILGCRAGKFFAIEVKMPKGKQSAEQVTWENRLKEAGGHYWIARSLEDFERLARLILNWRNR
jgi:hypothetical protein